MKWVREETSVGVEFRAIVLVGFGLRFCFLGARNGGETRGRRGEGSMSVIFVSGLRWRQMLDPGSGFNYVRL
jgi:hypothetical protein